MENCKLGWKPEIKDEAGRFAQRGGVAGKDHHGKDAPMGAIVSQDFENALNALAIELIKNKVKEITLQLSWTKGEDASFIIVEQSIKNGLLNIQSHLTSFEKLSGLKINSSYNIIQPKTNEQRVNSLNVKYLH